MSRFFDALDGMVHGPRSRWSVLVAVLWLGWIQAAAAESNAESAGIHPSLKETRDWIASSNLAEVPMTPPRKADWIKECQSKLESARRCRGEKNLTQAEKDLLFILESDAPEEIKRAALLELALVVQQQNQLGRAQQIFAQFAQRYPEDPSLLEVLLRQGLLYRQMNCPTLAMAKFYCVMTTALNLKLDQFEYHQRLVLQAQTEIADTCYQVGKFQEAAEFYSRLMQLQMPALNKPVVHFKWIDCLHQTGRDADLIAQARRFLESYPQDSKQAEVRFLLAVALKRQGQTAEAIQQVMTLLESQQEAARQDPQTWAYWQQRAGNELANQLYSEADYTNALGIYRRLAALNNSLAWQMPVWYQIGLVSERLRQMQQAAESYDLIVKHEKDLGTNTSPGLRVVVDMAKWRKEYVAWMTQAEQSEQQLHLAAPPAQGQWKQPTPRLSLDNTW